MLEDTGIINNFIHALSAFSRCRSSATNGAVMLGMVYNYLPYMILPLYTVIMKIDRRLIEAAQDLGCTAVAGLYNASSCRFPCPAYLSRPYDGLRPGGIDVLHLPEARLHRHDAHRRRYRVPVQDRLQPEPRRGH